MSDILHLAVDDGRVRTLQVPAARLDPATQQVVDAEVDAARRAAFAEGEVSGRALAADDLARAVDAVSGALGRVHRELTEQRDQATAASLEVAHAAASVVLDRTPPADALEVLERVREASRILDAEAFTVAVHPDDAAVLEELPAIAGLRWVADASLPPGEARIETEHGGADLTRRALLDAAIRLLGEDGT